MGDKIEYCINNLNREKIFKEIVKITDVYDVKITTQNIVFSVNKKEQKKIEQILEKKNAKIINKKIIGGINFLKNSILRLEILIPIIIFIVFLIISNQFVFRIELQGIQQIQKSEIINVLEQENIKNVTLKNNINIKELENSLLKIDKVSLVSVVIKGNTLIINIKEKLYNPEYEDKDNFLPIVSNYSGIVTKIDVVQGTPLVKVGQTIKHGQSLIAPYVIDTSGEMRAVYAQGRVYADVFFSSVSEIGDTYINYVSTGNIVVNKQIFIGNVKIYDQQKDCLFKEYKTDIRETVISNNILPLRVVETQYNEQSIEIIDDYFNKNQQQILEDCKQKTRQLIPNYDIIKDEYYEITTLAGINRITYTCLAELLIC